MLLTQPSFLIVAIVFSAKEEHSREKPERMTDMARAHLWESLKTVVGNLRAKRMERSNRNVLIYMRIANIPPLRTC